MKKITILLLTLCAIELFTSCDNRAKVTGQWQGNITETQQNHNMDMGVTLMLGQDGKVNADLKINQTEAVPIPGETEEFAVNVACSATAQGTWQYVTGEDDEVAITFDPTTLKVSVDPADIVFKTSIPLDSMPELESIRTMVAQQYQSTLTQYLTRKYTHVVLDDVKVQKPLLKFEVNDVDYTFHQVTE